MFAGGCEEEVRREAWKFLLGMYPKGSTAAQRAELAQVRRRRRHGTGVGEGERQLQRQHPGMLRWVGTGAGYCYWRGAGRKPSDGGRGGGSQLWAWEGWACSEDKRGGDSNVWGLSAAPALEPQTGE